MTDESDRKEEPAPKPRPKRQPPVIDAEAKEIPRPSHAGTNDDAQDAPPSSATRSRLLEFHWHSILPAVVVALIAGLSGGILGAWLFAAPTAPAADTAPLNNTIAQLSTRLSVQEAKQQTAPDLSPLNERSAKLETATGELRGALAEVKKLVDAQDNAPTAAEVAAVNRRLAAIEEKIGALSVPKADQPRTNESAEVVALGALRDAIASGAPFAAELNAVRGLIKDRASTLAPLEKFAASGLPTVPVLARRFEPLAAKIANPPPPTDGGVINRLWNNAGRLIEVRPVGEPQGSDAGAVVARMETKLARGDLAGALDESKALSPSARELGKDWFEAADRRRDADLAIKQLLNAALAAIAAERPKQ